MNSTTGTVETGILMLQACLDCFCEKSNFLPGPIETTIWCSRIASLQALVEEVAQLKLFVLCQWSLHMHLRSHQETSNRRVSFSDVSLRLCSHVRYVKAHMKRDVRILAKTLRSVCPKMDGTARQELFPPVCRTLTEVSHCEERVVISSKCARMRRARSTVCNRRRYVRRTVETTPAYRPPT